MTRTKEIEQEIKSLRDENPRKRFRAIARLGELAANLPMQERKKVVEELGKLVNDSEAFVRWSLAIAFGKIGHPSAIPYLDKLGRFDEHANVRFRVALALGLIGHESGVPILEAMAEDKYEISQGVAVIREFAAIALGMIPAEASITALKKFVNDQDPVVRWHVAVSLGNIGHPNAIPLLAKLVDDPIPFTRAHTAIALAQIGDKSARPYLEKLVQDSVDRVARISKDALKLLQQ